MAGENNKQVEGLGAGKMQLTGDFVLRHEDGTVLFSVDSETGDVTSSGTQPAGPPSGAAGGDLGGTYPNPSVEALNTTGASVNVGLSAPPTSGQVLKATSATTAAWQADTAGSPAGSNDQVQFNSAGAFDASADFTWDDTNKELTISGGDGNTHFVANETTTSSTAIVAAIGDNSAVGTTTNHDFGVQTNSLDRIKILKTGEVGVGTTTPSASLDLVGTLQYTDGNQGASKVLTSDASGNATWQTAAGGSPGGATGNVQFNNAGAFAGDADLFWDDTNERLGIGTAVPLSHVHIASTGIDTFQAETTADGGVALKLIVANPTSLETTTNHAFRIGANNSGKYINIADTGNPTSFVGIQIGGEVRLQNAGTGLAINRTGSLAKIGSVALVAGTATVSKTNLTANSRIFLTSRIDGGTPGFVRITNITAATSFTITSSDAGDTSTIDYLIIEAPAL